MKACVTCLQVAGFYTGQALAYGEIKIDQTALRYVDEALTGFMRKSAERMHEYLAETETLAIIDRQLEDTPAKGIRYERLVDEISARVDKLPHSDSLFASAIDSWREEFADLSIMRDGSHIKTKLEAK